MVLPSQLENGPDLPLEEHREALEEACGVKVSKATIARVSAVLAEGGGWPLKKSPR